MSEPSHDILSLARLIRRGLENTPGAIITIGDHASEAIAQKILDDGWGRK